MRFASSSTHEVRLMRSFRGLCSHPYPPGGGVRPHTFGHDESFVLHGVNVGPPDLPAVFCPIHCIAPSNEEARDVLHVVLALAGK
jgi:hypothetical protein